MSVEDSTSGNLKQYLETFIKNEDWSGLYNAVDHLVRYDSKLTTLLNAPAFKTEVQERYSRYFIKKGRAATGHVALLFIDLDNFKDLNDTMGHLAGDEVLHGVEGVLSEVLRQTDITGRFGGEELLVAIETEDEGDYYLVAEKLRAKIQAMGVMFEGKLVKVTASIGVSRLVAGDTYEGWMTRANWLMKYAKAHGKNRAVPEGDADVMAWIAEHQLTQ